MKWDRNISYKIIYKDNKKNMIKILFLMCFLIYMHYLIN